MLHSQVYDFNCIALSPYNKIVTDIYICIKYIVEVYATS